MQRTSASGQSKTGEQEMKKILLLGSQHGDELLGEKLYNHIINHHPELLPFVTYKVGNLKAKRQKTRYIESDLNRSYNCGNDTYEKRRSKRIIKYIKDNQFDLVIDLHTTTCPQPPCIIIPSINPDIVDYLNASFINKIIQIDFNVINHSLIGTYSKSISIEVSKKQISAKLLNNLADDINKFIKSEKNLQPKTVYQVQDFIHKDSLSNDEINQLHNFELSDKGYYPVLIGEKTYKKQTNYLGFKAENTYPYIAN